MIKQATLVMFMGFGLVLPHFAQAQDMATGEAAVSEEVRKAVLERMEFLKGQGFHVRARTMPTGVVIDFRKPAEDSFVFATLVENNLDPGCFRLVLPVIYQLKSEDERARVLSIANEVNGNWKAAKVVVENNDVHVYLDVLHSQPDGYKSVFERTMLIYRDVYNDFYKRLQPNPVPLALN